MTPKTNGTREAEIALADVFWKEREAGALADMTPEERAAALETQAGSYDPDCEGDEEDCL